MDITFDIIESDVDVTVNGYVKESGGSGSVTSVNGQIGDVVLTADDIGAASADDVASLTDRVGTLEPNTVKLDLDSATDYYVEVVYPDTEMDKIVSAYEKGNLSISADLISGIIDEYLTAYVILGSDRLLIRASSSSFADEKAQFDESGGCVFDDAGGRHNISDFSYNLGFSGFVVTLSDETDEFIAGNSYQFYFGLYTITRTVPAAETAAYSRLWEGRTWIGGCFYDGYNDYNYSIIPESFL